MHIPAYKKCDGADTAVVFIHGFMGSPDQFEDLAETVHGLGCAYMSVLLPGHGCGIDGFVKSGEQYWTRHVQSELDKIKNDYARIFIVGHSMGGLLALNASIIRENNIAGLVLLATPLKIHLLNPKAMSKRLRFLRLPGDHEIKAAYMKAFSLTKSKFFYYPLFVRPAISFLKLMKRTKKRLPEVFVPVCMFYSKNDETTSYKSVKLLDKGLCSTQKTLFALDKSWHAFYSEDENKIIRDRLIEFIQS